ncbi:MAG: hypothetical protein L0H64_24395, partial [Pseudonocardia sp.]|nr:hypothetical protein [Pseudonocardia sp.]
MVRRFAVPERRLGFWVVGWVGLAAAVFGVLVPLLTRGPALTSLLLRNLWLLLLVAILLTFLSGGRLRTRPDRITVGAVALSLLVISPLWLLFLDVPGNLLFLWPDVRTAAAVDAVQQWLYLPIALAVAGVRWWVASRPGRRALLPSVAGNVAGLVGLPVPYVPRRRSGAGRGGRRRGGHRANQLLHICARRGPCWPIRRRSDAIRSPPL